MKEEKKTNMKKVFFYHTTLVIITMFIGAIAVTREQALITLLLSLPTLAGMISVYKSTTIFHEMVEEEK